MEEIMEAVQPEMVDTTEEPAAQAETDTDPAAIPEQEDAQADAAQDTDDTQEDTESPPESPPVVRVKHNKQERAMPLEEATPYVEMGLKYESFKPSMEKLRYIAQSVGQSVPDMIEQLVRGHEANLYTKALDETGGNEAAARKLADLQIAEGRRKYEAATAALAQSEAKESEEEKAALESRLASDFLELSREMPGKYADIGKVPPAILQLAVSRGIPLLDAVLRYERTQAKKSEAVKTGQAKAAAQSTGTMSGTTEKGEDAQASAFAASFNSAW